jgi:hypothetical protein
MCADRAWRWLSTLVQSAPHRSKADQDGICPVPNDRAGDLLGALTGIGALRHRSCRIGPAWYEWRCYSARRRCCPAPRSASGPMTPTRRGLRARARVGRALLSAAIAAEQPIPIAIIQSFFCVALAGIVFLSICCRRLASRLIPSACALAAGRIARKTGAARWGASSILPATQWPARVGSFDSPAGPFRLSQANLAS